MLSSWTKSAALLLGLVFLLLPSADAEMKCQICMGKGTTRATNPSVVPDAEKVAVDKARAVACDAAGADNELDCSKWSDKPWSCWVDAKSGDKDCMMTADPKLKACPKTAEEKLTENCACEDPTCNKIVVVDMGDTKEPDTSSGDTSSSNGDTSSSNGDTSSQVEGETSGDGSTSVKGWPFELLLLAAALVWGQQRLRSQA